MVEAHPIDKLIVNIETLGGCVIDGSPAHPAVPVSDPGLERTHARVVATGHDNVA